MFALFSLVCCSMTRCKSVICMSKSQWQTGLHSGKPWGSSLVSLKGNYLGCTKEIRLGTQTAQ